MDSFTVAQCGVTLAGIVTMDRQKENILLTDQDNALFGAGHGGVDEVIVEHNVIIAGFDVFGILCNQAMFDGKDMCVALWLHIYLYHRNDRVK